MTQSSLIKLALIKISLSQVISARSFVSWANGHPNFKNFSVDLSKGKAAVIIGQGNVSLDVIRLLFKEVDELAKTDISSDALRVLRNNSIKVIHLIGRRGPAQSAFTTGELREVLALKNCKTFIVDKHQYTQLNEESMEELKKERGKKRMWDLLMGRAESLSSEFLNDEKIILQNSQKALVIHYLTNPVEFLATQDQPSARLTSLKFEKMKLTGKPNQQQAIGTSQFGQVNCNYAFRSIGYKSVAVAGVPFDQKQGIVPNVHGRVVSAHDNQQQPTTGDQKQAFEKGLYVTGWLKRGPSGIIGTNKFDADDTVASVLLDIQKATIAEDEKPGKSGLQQLLKERNIQFITFEDWKKIDAYEREMGDKQGKPREKITSIEELLRIAKS